MALRDHFTTDDKAAIGYLDYPSESRKQLALKSRFWKCKLCSYDAAKLTNCDTNVMDEGCSGAAAISRDAHKSENNRLFIIGLILLLLSVVMSYAYLYNSI